MYVGENADPVARWRRLYNEEELGAYGIYVIEAPVEDLHFYIGQTKVSFEKRWLQHLSDLDGGRHANKHMQAAYRLHGPGWFSFHVVEFITDPKIVNERELWWLKYQQKRHGRELMWNIREMPPRYVQLRLPFEDAQWTGWLPSSAES